MMYRASSSHRSTGMPSFFSVRFFQNGKVAHARTPMPDDIEVVLFRTDLVEREPPEHKFVFDFSTLKEYRCRCRES